MEQKLVCDTVRDLLPTYVEHLTSEASDQSIEQHIQECHACREVLEQMKQEVEVDTAPEVKSFKKYLRKSKREVFYRVMAALAVIAMVVCFIVNLATEGRMSWSLIVYGGIIGVYVPAYVLLSAKKHRFIKFLAAANICGILLLGLIQIINIQMLKDKTIWFWNIGLPIALLWTAILWIGVLCKQIFKLNIYLACAIICLLAVPGNVITNIISGGSSQLQDIALYYISGGLGVTIVGITLAVIGVTVQIRKKTDVK